MFPFETQLQKRPVWLLSMDSDEFNAPPTTTASLAAYFQRYGATAETTEIELVHFQSPDDIAPWQAAWTRECLSRAKQASNAGQQPVVGFSFYTWNAAEFARSLGASEGTARRYLDIVAGAFMVRILPPWFENLGKRQVRSPKIYVRDSGLLHSLLDLGSPEELAGHPKVGASFEGFAIEQVR